MGFMQSVGKNVLHFLFQFVRALRLDAVIVVWHQTFNKKRKKCRSAQISAHFEKCTERGVMSARNERLNLGKKMNICE